MTRFVLEVQSKTTSLHMDGETAYVVTGRLLFEDGDTEHEAGQFSTPLRRQVWDSINLGDVLSFDLSHAVGLNSL